MYDAVDRIYTQYRCSLTDEQPHHGGLFGAQIAQRGFELLLVVALVALLYVDQTTLSSGWKQVVRLIIPSAAIFLPVAFFLSVVSPSASKPNRLIYLAYVGAVALAVGLLC